MIASVTVPNLLHDCNMTTAIEPSSRAATGWYSAPQDVRMPFSSPVGEEVLSPTSPNTPYHHISPHRNGLQNSKRMEGNSSSSRRKSALEDSPRPRKGNRSLRPRWPGLNVVTNFSRPPILAQRAAHTFQESTTSTTAALEAEQSQAMILPSRAYSGPKKRGQERQGEQINELKTAPHKADVHEAAQVDLQHAEDVEHRTMSSATNNKGPVKNLKRKSSRISELSPSDRVIAIGISVTPTSIGGRTSSPEASRGKTLSLANRQYARSQLCPITPSILVTSANEEAPWSATSSERQIRYKPRPASSVYSQATHRGRSATQPSAVPPVPLLPNALFHQKPRNASEPLIKGQSSSASPRVTSTCTVFEEDSPEQGLQGRSNSGESQLRLLPRSSTDSLATRHRSQGWWNYILSPFSAKPSTPVFSFKKSHPGMPELDSPHSSDVTRIGEETEEDTQDKKAVFSPPVRNSLHTDKTHTSFSADGSYPEKKSWESSPDSYVMSWSMNMALNCARDNDDVKSPDVTLSPEGFGAAAEYYQACWHDQDSPTPYFECQNHICLPFAQLSPQKERLMLSMPEGPTDPDPKESRDKPNDAPDALKHPVFQQIPSNRFSAAFKQALTPKARPPSGETVIEEVDTTPEVEEAHAAPVIRAPAPVPAPQAQAQPAESVIENLRGSDDHQEPPIGPQQPRALGVQSKPVQNPPTEAALPAAETTSTKRIVAVKPVQTVKPPLERHMPLEPTTKPTEGELMPQQTISPERTSPITHREFAPERFLPVESPPPATQNDLTGKRNVTSYDTHLANDQRPVYIVNHYHGNYLSNRPVQGQREVSDLYPPPREKSTVDEMRDKFQRIEVEPSDEKKVQKPKSGSRVKCQSCISRKRPMKKKTKWLLIGIGIALIIMIVLILVLAMTLTRKGDEMPVQSQWLNITGFPPIPTGISTVIDPDAAYAQSGCVSPTTMWSCALPKEEQASIAPNAPDQPNFRVEIRFQNGTNVSSGTNSSLQQRSDEYAPNAVSARNLIRRKILHVRDSLSSALFTPSPAPPSLEDQTFLGKTTDNITASFDGEITPFFMSFESTNKLSRLVKRANGLTNSTNSTDPLPDLGSAIPPPEINPDGTAAPANLLPFPSSQPLRLFNRGGPTEHYGFYIYFDRSIFLASTALLNSTTEAAGNVPGDENGGAEETAATVRCTWAQTRFLVQIWTNQGQTTSLLTSSNSTAANSTGKHPKNLTESSANDFSRPGSFPYPVSITLDRHGGDIKTKEIFCYGVDDRQRIIPSQKKLQLEDRSFQGNLVNPALGPFGHVNVSTSEGGPGGIDGGTGGCGCIWRNWHGAQ